MQRIRKFRKVRIGDATFDIVNILLLLVILFITFYPFYYVVVQSLNEGTASMTSGSYWFPKNFTLENYENFFSDAKWVRALGVSAARTIFGTCIGLFFTCIVSYALSFKELAMRKGYMTLLIISMYFSGGIIPYYVLLRSLNLLNTFYVYIIPGALSAFFVLVGISFFQGIPSELFDAARVDGANDLTVFVRIVLPVSKAFLATIALFLGVEHWNAWFDSAFYVQAKELKTLSFLMMELINKSQVTAAMSAADLAARGTSTVTSFSIQSAAMVVAVLPIICVYPFLQRYFVKGIMIGSVKG